MDKKDSMGQNNKIYNEKKMSGPVKENEISDRNTDQTVTSFLLWSIWVNLLLSHMTQSASPACLEKDVQNWGKYAK